jgi:hypothetical protein
MLNQNNETDYPENIHKNNYSIMLADELELSSKKKNNLNHERFSRSQKDSSSVRKRDYVENEVFFFLFYFFPNF